MNSPALPISFPKTSIAPSFSDRQRIAFVVLIAFAAIVPSIVFGIPSNRDLSNHFRFALPFYDALRAGHIYPGWLAESNAGYGDASFRFYPPGLYYLLAFTRALSGNWFMATLATFAGVFVIGAVGMYSWARCVMPARDAMWAAVIFTLAPYHLNQFYQASMLAEFAGASLLPFAFCFVERICLKRDRRDVAGLAISYALLILTHLPLAVIGSLALLVYALARVPRQRLWSTLLRLTSAVFLGLAASACFWVTVIAEKNWIRADNIMPDPSVDYRGNFVLSTLSPDNLNVWWMNILLLGTVAMCWPAVAIFWTSKGRNNQIRRRRGIRATWLLLLLTLFMATPVSRPIWSLLRPLQETQFPWRWLVLTTMSGSVLLASAIPLWKGTARSKRRPVVIIAMGTIAISFAFSASHTVREAQYFTASVFQETLQEIPGSQGVSQWWPSWVNEPIQKMSSPVDAGARAVMVTSWEPERRTFSLGAGQSREVRVRTFFYPHWHAVAGGQELPVRPDKDGALLITVPEQPVSVNLQFREPQRVLVASIITILGWLAICALFITRSRTHGQAASYDAH